MLRNYAPVARRVLDAMLVAWLATGCTTPQKTSEVPTAVGAAPQPAPVAAVAPQPQPQLQPLPQPQPQPLLPEEPGEPGEPGVPITLPILDAMFADETFAGELGSKLGLSDGQILQLRVIARAATADLREREDGSTQAAANDAARQLRGIVSDAELAALTRFVHEHWSKDEDGNIDRPSAASNLANGVPSDTRIVVNAPAYRMDIFRDGVLLKTYKIGIGYPEFPLPTGLRRATSIIFNPSWTPPDEPWVEGKFAAGRQVDAGSALNPLGPIKIPIGMPSLIHGGKAAWRLGGFASHGCVGLTDGQVKDFAAMLAEISNTRISAIELASYEADTSTTKRVKLAAAIPVELRYETIVVEDGKLLIYRDVYERGTDTEERVRAVLAANGVSLDALTDRERAAITRGLRRMALDASGKVPAEQTNARRSTSAAVTRSIKGAKAVIVDIAALKGVGYPAPVALSRK